MPIPTPRDTDAQAFVIAVPAPDGWRPLRVVTAANAREALRHAPPDAMAVPAPMEPLH